MNNKLKKKNPDGFETCNKFLVAGFFKDIEIC